MDLGLFPLLSPSSVFQIPSFWLERMVRGKINWPSSTMDSEASLTSSVMFPANVQEAVLSFSLAWFL